MVIHPLMLAWIGGASVPLVLHLLSRSQYRPVHWGAMMFLTGADAGTHHAAHLKQWVLLFLRMAMIGLLAVALARPVISARYASVPTAGLTTGGPEAAVIILDDSGSMAYEKDAKPRMDQAREVTLQILSALKRGDQAGMLIAGAREFQPPIPVSADLQSIAAKVSDLQPDTGSCDFSTEIIHAADLLEHAKPADHEIYIITDQQALNWRAINDAFKQHWTARRSTAPPLRMTVFSVGGNEADNVAVDGFEIPDRVVVRDTATDLQVRIRNYGPVAVNAVPVSVWTGSRSLGESTISVPAHSTRVVNIPVQFFEPGSHVVSAAVKSTGLTTDDRLDYSVDVLDWPQVLLVSSAPATTQPVSPLGMALTAVSRKGVEPAVVTMASPADLTADRLKPMNVVMLDDVAQLSSEQMKLLEQFANEGGGIAFFPGANVASNLKKNPVYQSGNALVPLILQPPISPARIRQAEIANFDRQNPIFRFVGVLPDPFAKIPIRRYFPIGAHTKDLRILARFGTNDPFMVDASIGRGHSLLLTTPIDPEWNGLSASNHLQPLVQSMVRYLCQGAVVDRNLYAGQPITATVNDPVEDRSATVQYSSGGPRELVTVNRVNGHTELRYARPTRPGTYRLRYRTAGKEKVLSFVVNTGHMESDLTPLTAEQWRVMSDRLGFERVDLSHTTVAAAIDSQRGGREIWIELLGGVLGLMMVEMLLSRVWSSQS
jgi:hypothetical protein